MIRQVHRIDEIPVDRPVHIFGGGQGGRIVFDAMRKQGGWTVAGFIDSFRTEPLEGLPVLSPAQAVAEGAADRTVVIASQFWPEIAATLRDAGCRHIYNAYSVIAARQKDAVRPDLAEALRSATGYHPRELVSSLLASPHFKQGGGWATAMLALDDFAQGAPLYVVGTHQRARQIAMLATQSGRSVLAGYIDPSLPDDAPAIAMGSCVVYPLQRFLTEADPSAVVVDPMPGGGLLGGATLRAVLQERGFLRCFDASSLALPDGRHAPAPVLPPAEPLPDMPLVSVVLVCRNAAAMVRRSIESVLRQTYPNIEYIIQDGASTDGTQALIEEYRSHPDWNGRIHLVSEVDGNAAIGLLRGLRRCRGDIIATCMADEELLPDAVAEAVRAFRRTPGTGVVTGDAYTTGRDGRFTGVFTGGPFSLAGYLFGSYCPYFSSTFFSRRALEEIGLHEEDWNQDVVEFELWMRLATRHTITHHPFRFSKYALYPQQLSNVARHIRFHLFRRIEVLSHFFSLDGFFGPVKNLYGLWEECIVRQYALFYNHALSVGEDVAELGIPLRRDQTIPIDLPPVDAEIHKEIAALYEMRGQVDEAVHILREARPAFDETADSLAVQILLKSPAATNRDLLDAQLDWADRHVRRRPLDERNLPPLKRGPDGKRIKVAYICPFATASYFQFQVVPFVLHHDPAQFEIYCYTAGIEPPDLAAAGVTVRLVDHLTDEEFIALLRRDGIDVALELTGFSAGHRYRAMGARVAPVQISYINHTGTCGVDAFDYCIADARSAPSWLDPYFTERIYRIDGCFFCFDYRGSDAPPAAAQPPVLTSGQVTFGCFGSGSKFNADLIALWSRLLRAVPQSRLLLRNASLSWVDNRRFLADLFARNGIGPERLMLEAGGDRLEIMADYARVDISLDSFPYCGGNTIAESLHQGVPVVTLRGSTFASCYGSSILEASGCADLVADTPDDYVRLAAELAAAPERLAVYRTCLRDMMVEHGFSDSERFARKLEAAYRDMLGRLPS